MKERGCEVTVAGRGSETEGIGFSLGRVSGAIYVVKGKMTRRTPIHRLTEGHTRVEEELASVLNICIW